MSKPEPARHSVESSLESSLEPSRVRADSLLPLARSASGGDRAAITTLIMALGGAVLKTVRQVLGPQHPDVEDVAQEALMAFMSGLASFRGDSSVRHYAKRVALNTALSARRRLTVQKRHAEEQERALEPELPRSPGSPHALAVSNRRRELLRNLLVSLPVAISEALAMHFILGWTVQEIARDAGVSEHTVWSRLRLGKKALRRALSNDARLGELCDPKRP